MKVCIVGSGAVGALIGGKLAASGHDVFFIDKGIQLEALQKNGLRLIWEDGREVQIRNLKASERFEDAGQQDAIILAVKAHHIPVVARKLPLLFGPDTSLVTCQNGIPWWYFQRHGGTWEGHKLESLDPTGIITSHVDAQRIVGSIVYFASEIIEPGVIHHVEGNKMPLGELDGTESVRCTRLTDALNDAGFKSRIIPDIRAELWLKAWGTLSFNPISALTHATLAQIAQFEKTRILAAEMMKEAQDIATKLDIKFRHTIERRLAGAEAVGAHKTSMLQDVESGKNLELEALLGSIIEIGRMTDTPTPRMETVYACTKLLNKTYKDASAKVRFVCGTD